MTKPRLYIGAIVSFFLIALGLQAWRFVSSRFFNKTAAAEEESYYPFDREAGEKSQVSLNNTEMFLGDYESDIALPPEEETEAAPKPVLFPSNENAPAAAQAEAADQGEMLINEKPAEISAENDRIEEAVLKKYSDLPIMRQFNAQLKAAAGDDEEKLFYFFLNSDKQTLNPEIKEVFENFSKNPQFTAVVKQMLDDKDFLLLLKKYGAPRKQTDIKAE